MCENTLLERLMSKLAEHGADVRKTVEADGDLRFELGEIIRKTVYHEVLFDGGLMARARIYNWTVWDQENCADEVMSYNTDMVAEQLTEEAAEVNKLFENGATPTAEQVNSHITVMYAAVLGLEYTVRRKLNLTPGVDQAPNLDL